MRRSLFLFLILATPPALAADKPLPMVALPLVGQRLDPDTVKVLSTLVIDAIHKLKVGEVISPEDVAAMLSMEQAKDALGCDDVTCTAEIAGALGADTVVTGTASRLADQVIVSLRLYDQRTAKIKASTEERMPAHEAQYADGITYAVRRLFGLVADEVGTAVLRVQSEPKGATVLLDGMPVGETPLHLDEHPVGQHELSLEKSGYVTRNTDIDISDQKDTYVGASLMPCKPHEVTVAYVDGGTRTNEGNTFFTGGSLIYQREFDTPWLFWTANVGAGVDPHGVFTAAFGGGAGVKFGYRPQAISIPTMSETIAFALGVEVNGFVGGYNGVAVTLVPSLRLANLRIDVGAGTNDQGTLAANIRIGCLVAF